MLHYLQTSHSCRSELRTLLKNHTTNTWKYIISTVTDTAMCFKCISIMFFLGCKPKISIRKIQKTLPYTNWTVLWLQIFIRNECCWIHAMLKYWIYHSAIQYDGHVSTHSKAAKTKHRPKSWSSVIHIILLINSIWWSGERIMGCFYTWTNVTVYKQSEGIQHCNTVMSCATNATVKATKTHILSWKAIQKQIFMVECNIGGENSRKPSKCLSGQEMSTLFQMKNFYITNNQTVI